jgi:hypothetical protein
MLDEIEANELGTSIAGYCDLEKFYDSINIPKLITHAMACGFPLAALTLLLQVHLGTRLLRVNKWVSEPILPYTSIIAGCRASGHLARVLLYPVLQMQHDAEPIPRALHFRCFVDDLVVRIQHPSRGGAINKFTALFGEVLEQLTLRALTHSPLKTIIRSNDNSAASKASQNLANLGLAVKANIPVMDLGTPVGSGKTRVATSAQKRLRGTDARRKRTKWLVKKNRKALHIVKTGLVPAMTWGGPAFGTPPPR